MCLWAISGSQFAAQPRTSMIMITQSSCCTALQSNGLPLQRNGCCSVERIIEYTTRFEPEAPAVIEGHRPPQDWPQEGRIDFQNIVVRYRPGLPPVIKGLTFCIEPQEKVSCLILNETGCVIDLSMRLQLQSSPTTCRPGIPPFPCRPLNAYSAVAQLCDQSFI